MSTLETADMAIFFSDFATSVTATTWGKTIVAIFDIDYADFDGEVSRESPFILVQSSDIPSTKAEGDLFTINGTVYKLVDVEYAEPGLHRVRLAST